MEMIRIHDCATGRIIDRARTSEEQAIEDEARVRNAEALAKAEQESLRMRALKALEEAALATASSDPNAPQAVKDYAAALRDKQE